jgi:hypothetical protein
MFAYYLSSYSLHIFIFCDGLVERVTRLGQTNKNDYTLVGKLEERNDLEYLGADGKIILKSTLN